MKSKHLAVGEFNVVPQKNYHRIKKDFQDVTVNPDGTKTYNKVACLLEGSSRSGKTYDICLFLWELVNTYENKVIVIARDTFSNLSKTVYQTMRKAWVSAGANPEMFKKRPTTLSINGNTILFTTLNNGQNMGHGFESYVLWINELQTCDRKAVQELIQRNQRFMIFDYNPNMVESWIYKLPNNPKYAWHHSTFRDNKFISQNELQTILSYEPTPENIEAGTAELYRWQVYGLGLRAVNEDSIFKNIKRYEVDPINFDFQIIGLDWGFVDPTAIVLVTVNGKKMYIEVLKYETMLSNDAIASRLENLPYIEEVLVVCDSAEQKSIQFLKDRGIAAYPAQKPPGSLEAGIARMMNMEIYVKQNKEDEADVNEIIMKEFNAYVWKKDNAGNFVYNKLGKRVPVDRDNHAIDAARYALSFYKEKTVALEHELD